MTRLIATRGLPGSGKSTWANAEILKHEAGTWIRVNRDSLRDMLHAGRWKGNKTENFTKLVQREIVSAGLRDGKTVIVDDTNLSPKTIQLLEILAEEYDWNLKLEIQDFTDVPLETCIKRDLQREKSVGEAVIRKMYREFLAPKPEIYNPDPSLPHAIICDIDGTLAIKGDRDIYDYSKVHLDTPNMPVVHLAQVLGEERLLIFVSGREDNCRMDTMDWLKDNLGFAFTPDLFMRKTGDMRKDSIVKREIFDEYIRDKYQIDYVLDDRDQVVEMWRSLGLTVLQVAEGNF